MKLTKQNGGSEKYGVCEVCKKWADVIFSRQAKPENGGVIFGHADCLYVPDDEEPETGYDAYCGPRS